MIYVKFIFIFFNNFYFNISSTSRNDICVSLRSLKIQFLCYKFVFFFSVYLKSVIFVFPLNPDRGSECSCLCMLYYLNYLCNSSVRTGRSLGNLKPRSNAVTDLMSLFLEIINLVVPQLHPLQNSLFCEGFPNRRYP